MSESAAPKRKWTKKQWKMEGNPHWKGGIKKNSHGYRLIYLGDGKYQGEHVLIAEKALGKPLPRGAIVHHHDENRINNHNSNLVICQDISYHMLIHARMRIMKAGGNPDLHKICCDCGEMKSMDDFHKSKSEFNGLASRCRPCKAISRQKYKTNS